MIVKLLIFIIVFSSVIGCSNKSIWVVLYRDEVAKGNSIVWFANYDDEQGYWANEHCLKLAEIYKKEDARNYICSKTVFQEFKPKVN